MSGLTSGTDIGYSMTWNPNWTPTIIVTGADGDCMTLSRAGVEDSYRMLQEGRSHAELRRLADAGLLSTFDLRLVERLDSIAASLGLSPVGACRGLEKMAS